MDKSFAPGQQPNPDELDEHEIREWATELKAQLRIRNARIAALNRELRKVRMISMMLRIRSYLLEKLLTRLKAVAKKRLSRDGNRRGDSSSS